MASVSSTSSKSSSLGNTALSGFGGLASGLDRDALIEQMTASTQNKITKANQETTKLEWRQEAIRDIADKVIDLQDDFLSFTGSNSIKNTDLFSTNVVTAEGSDEATKYVKASGASEMSKYIQVKAVTQTATSASIVSAAKTGNSGISLANITAENLLKEDAAVTSNLAGKSLSFGSYSTDQRYTERTSFKFPASYSTIEDGATVTHTINYTDDNKEKLVEDLNKALEQNPVYLNGDQNSKLKFEYHKDDASGKDYIYIKAEGAAATFRLKEDQNSFAALGFKDTFDHSTGAENKDNSKRGISLEQFNENTSSFVSGKDADGNLLHEGEGFSKSSTTKRNMLDVITGKDFSVSYNGSSKNVKMLTAEEKNDIIAAATDKSTNQVNNEQLLNGLQVKFQQHLDSAFGTGKVKVSINNNGALELTNATDGDGKTITINSSDAALRDNIGIMQNASTKLTTNASLWENRDKLFGADAVRANNWTSEEDMTKALQHFKINGVEIEGIDAKTTVNQMLNKINNSSAGVKASYMEGSGKLVLIAKETGSGRQITLGDAGKDPDAVDLIFGGGYNEDGKDAELIYDYGNGVNETITSSSNTFNIDGMKVTVSGTFGVQKDADGVQQKNADGSWRLDSSKSVSFSSKANVDKATETVKKFVEAYNEIVKSVNEHSTTRPSSGYDPLTEEQKEEMSDKSIENWEKKAKEGILYNESSVRNMSNDLQTVMTTMMQNLNRMGLSYNDMENIGLSMSSDYYDGGKIEFDEDKFKAAMESQPDVVSKVMSGSNGVSGLAKVIEDTTTKYATRYSSRNGGSYGQLVVAGGSNKISMSKQKNSIYTALKENEEQITKLKELLKTEQNRYVSQFTALEKAINNMNTQASYLSNLTG